MKSNYWSRRTSSIVCGNVPTAQAAALEENARQLARREPGSSRGGSRGSARTPSMRESDASATDSAIANKDRQLVTVRKSLLDSKKLVAERDAEIERLKSEQQSREGKPPRGGIAKAESSRSVTADKDKDKMIADRDKMVADRDKKLAEMRKQVSELNEQIADAHQEITDRDAQIAAHLSGAI